MHQTTIALRKGLLKANKVTSREDHIIELRDAVTTRIHVLEEVPTFCVVKLKGNIPPLKIKISYENSGGDLEIYGSMITSEPSEKNYRYKYLKNPELITINKTNEFEKCQFQENAVYFRLDSFNGCKIVLRPMLGKLT